MLFRSLTEERSLSEYFEAVLATNGHDPKAVSNWMMNDVLRLIREEGITAGELRIAPSGLAELLAMLASSTINTPTAKRVLELAQASGKSPAAIVDEQGLAQVSDRQDLLPQAQHILESNPDQVETYRSGKTAILGWFVGQLMKQTEGKANPQLAREIFEELLAA